MNVLLKIAVFFVLCAALLLQGCAMNKSNLACAGAHGCSSGNAEVDQQWNTYAAEVNPELARGNRIAADGRTVLVPVQGAGVKGVFQTPDGRRMVHDRDCQKEGGGSSFFWGWVVPLSSLAIGVDVAPAIGQTVSNAARQHGSTARFYSCEDAKEFFAGGNVRLLQVEVAKVRQTCEGAGGTFSFDPSSGQGSCAMPAAAQASTSRQASDSLSEAAVEPEQAPAFAVTAASPPSSSLDAWCRQNASCPIGKVGAHLSGRECKCR